MSNTSFMTAGLERLFAGPHLNLSAEQRDAIPTAVREAFAELPAGDNDDDDA